MYYISLLPILFLSQRLVFITVVVVVIIIWLVVSSSFHSWCYWVFLFVCWYAIVSFFAFPHAVPSLFSFCSVSTFSFYFSSLLATTFASSSFSVPFCFPFLVVNYIYLNLTTKLNKNFITVKMWKSMSNRSMIIIYIKYHLQYIFKFYY